MEKKTLATNIIKQLFYDPEMAWYQIQAPLQAVKSAGKLGQGSERLNDLIDLYRDLRWLVDKEQLIIESLTTDLALKEVDIIKSLDDISVIAAVIEQGVSKSRIKSDIRNVLRFAKKSLNLIRDWADVYHDISYQFISNSIVIDQIHAGRDGQHSGFIFLVTPESQTKMKVLSYVRTIYAHSPDDSYYQTDIEYEYDAPLDDPETAAEKLIAEQAIGQKPFRPQPQPTIYLVGVTENYNYERIIKPVVQHMFEQEVFANNT